jgi:hypothetical protein
MSFSCFTNWQRPIGGVAMPDSTVDDGKGESWERELSQQHFEDFVVALLRSVASGDDSYRVREQFFRFLKHAQESGVPIGPVFQAALRDLNDRAIPVPDISLFSDVTTQIIQAALRVVAERASTDSLARARLSKRDRELSVAVEQYILEMEERSRANGWSYLNNLTKRIKKRPKDDPPVHP